MTAPVATNQPDPAATDGAGFELAIQPDGAVWIDCNRCGWHSFTIPPPLGGGAQQAMMLGLGHRCPETAGA
jgi:hypothetical protein